MEDHNIILLTVSRNLGTNGIFRTLYNSSPHFPESNGLVERKIQTVKKMLKKAHESDEDIYLALLMLNATPGRDNVAPAQKLFGHQIRTILPSMNKGLLEKHESPSEKQTIAGNRFRDLPVIEPGETVRVRTDKEKNWKEKGKVVSRCDEPRAYNVMKSNGYIVRRNRRHLIPTNEPFQLRYDSNGGEVTHNDTNNVEEQLGERVNDGLQDESLSLESSLNEAHPNAGLPAAVSEAPTPYLTRGGQTVRRPKRLDDYVSK